MHTFEIVGSHGLNVRDYLTIPGDDIQNIRVLMTMVGGKVVHLVPSLASEWSMQPTGAQVELGGAAAQW